MSKVSLKLITNLEANLFAPQASTETFLAVLLKLYGDVIERHLHIKDWKQAWVIFTAAGRIVLSQLISCQIILMWRCMMQT